MQSLITVVVPIYNMESYLDECMESICKQTYNNLEILLINDGSKDKSGELADKWAKEEPRCKVFHRENQGISGARNFGISMAKGEFIILVDSDDVLEDNMIERLYQEAVKEQVDIVCCGIKRRTSTGDYIKEYQVPSKIFTFTDYIYEMYSQEHGAGDIDMFLPLVAAWNKLYKTSLFKDIRYPVGKVNEDNAIIHRLVYAAGRTKWINEPLYIYRERAGSIMKSSFSVKRMDDFYAQLDRLNFMEDKTDNQKLKNMMTVRCLDTGRRYWCKSKSLKVWSDEKTENTFKDIKAAYETFVKKGTFSSKQKIIWFAFLRMRPVYYGLWLIAHKLKNR